MPMGCLCSRQRSQRDSGKGASGNLPAPTPLVPYYDTALQQEKTGPSGPSGSIPTGFTPSSPSPNLPRNLHKSKSKTAKEHGALSASTSANVPVKSNEVKTKVTDLNAVRSKSKSLAASLAVSTATAGASAPQVVAKMEECPKEFVKEFESKHKQLLAESPHGTTIPQEQKDKRRIRKRKA